MLSHTRPDFVEPSILIKYCANYDVFHIVRLLTLYRRAILYHILQCFKKQNENKYLLLKSNCHLLHARVQRLTFNNHRCDIHTLDD